MTLAELRAAVVPRVEEDAPHPSGNDRYRIYAVSLSVQLGTERRRRLAETSLDGIGLTLRTLREDGDLTDDTRIGILDRETREWLVNPWAVGR